MQPNMLARCTEQSCQSMLLQPIEHAYQGESRQRDEALPGRCSCLMATNVVALVGKSLSGKVRDPATGAAGLPSLCAPLATSSALSLRMHDHIALMQPRLLVLSRPGHSSRAGCMLHGGCVLHASCCMTHSRHMQAEAPGRQPEAASALKFVAWE